MGVIRKQGINSSILIYLGFALGAFNILVLFTRYLSLEQAGLIFLFVAIGKIILGVASFGNTAIMNKFFPYYNSYLERGKNDFLAVSLLLPAIGVLFTTLIWYLADDLIIKKTIEKSPLFVEYYFWVIPYAVFLIFYTALETYSYTRYLTVFPSFLRELGIRIITSFLVLLLFISAISFSGFVAAYSFIYLVLIVALFFYLKGKGEWNINLKQSKVTKRLKGHMLSYGAFVYGGIIIFALAENADTFIIGSLVGLGSVTVYQTAHFISTIIHVPYRSLSAITTPVISQAWKDKDLALIQQIYRKTSLNQLLAGTVLFGGIWVNIEFILNYLGENFDGVKEVVLILGIARVLDLGFGHNSEILSNSKYWKFNFFSYALLVLAFLPTNYLLVKSFGILGSAWSNLLSFTLFNGVRYVFLWVKCGLQPFNLKTIYILVLGALAYFITDNIVPMALDFLWFGVIIKSSLFLILLLVPVIVFQVSEDFNGLILEVWRKVFSRKT